MLIIVGHGPSAGYVPGDFVDKHTVVRIRDCPKLQKGRIGTRVDIIISSFLKHKRDGVEYWDLHEWRPKIGPIFMEFNPGFKKPSTGLSAVMIADILGYKDIGIMGFDYTLHPDRLKNHNDWRHDLRAENECLQSYIDAGIVTDLCEWDKNE